MKITEEQVEAWVGSDASVDNYIELITELANGDYKLDTLVSDITEFAQ